ncbi:MAG: hypothetical protein ACR2KT_01725 [Methylocella sp.]|nr:MAG: hypothetical protein DLM68_06060 [Hyphomicrobiales bacterium]
MSTKLSGLIRCRQVASAFRRAERERHGGETFTVPAKPRVLSQYELYPLPFFAAKDHSTWAVRPKGNYCEDYETGKAYAIEFLQSCDGTIGWCTLLSSIVNDMVLAGPTGTLHRGKPHVDGIIIGFMGTIGRALARASATRQNYGPPDRAAT